MEDLRQLISATTHLCSNQHLPEPVLSVHHCMSAAATAAAPPSNSYDPIMVGNNFFSRGFTQFAHDYSSSTADPTTNTTVAVTASDHAAAFCSLEAATAEKGWLGFDAGNNRWPRQETLSLLEIRSRLASKFRETNHKGPLWNEISGIMVEEYGYQRSGKKCKEKFENLYKYYKKTKEGKTGRQNGKHYRFFPQLEAIYGETNTHASTSETHHAKNTVAHQTPTSTNNQNSDVFSKLKGSDQSLSMSNSSDFETSSSENNKEDLSAIAFMTKQSREKQKGVDKRQSNGRVRKRWRVEVEELVESHMKKIIEVQEAWMERLLSVVEQREKEMESMEEERKKKESIRFDREVHELWAKEKAWVEARDAGLMEVVRKHIIGRELEALPLAEVMVKEPQNCRNKSHTNDAKEYPCEAADHSRRWTEMEVSNLIQLRTGFEHRLPENGYLENGLWDDIAAKMVCLGFDRSSTECKLTWDEISISLSKTMKCGA